VTKVAANPVPLTIQATAPTTRHEPYAFTGTRIGFMPGGAIENLLLAIAAAEETVAARQILGRTTGGEYGTTAPVYNPAAPQTTGLPLRLNTDLANYAMSSRLGKRITTVQGNDFTLAAPATEANVSGSFSTRNRDVEPFRDLSPATGIGIPPGIIPAIEAGSSEAVQLTLTGVVGSFGVGLPITGAVSGATAIIKTVDGTGTILTVGDFVGTLFNGELVSQAAPVASGTITPVTGISLLEGAVTSTSGGPATDGNVCIIIDTATGRRALDANGDVIFGRLIYDPAGGVSNSGEYSLTTSAGLLNFTASTDTVVVASAPGTVTTPAMIDVGDMIEGDDGRYYEIVSITGSPNVTSFNIPVAKPYVGPTQVNVADRRRRRFLLEFRSVTGGSEGSTTLAAGTYKFYFPTWYTLEKSNLDAMLLANAPGDAILPGASTTVEGVALAAPTNVAAPIPLIGALQTAQQAGVPVGAGNFHTINFSAGTSSSAPGVLDVVMTSGGTGPAGPTGPVGPAGPTGPGFSTIDPYQDKVLSTGGSPSSGTVAYNFTGTVRGFNTQTSLLNTGAFGPGQYQVSNVTASGTTVNVTFTGMSNFSLSVGVVAFI
jgi:hypothetical protein